MAKNKRKNGAKRRRSKATHEGLTPGTALTATLKGQVFSASVIVDEWLGMSGLGDESSQRWGLSAGCQEALVTLVESADGGRF